MLQLTDTISESSSLKLDYMERPSLREKELFDGTFVGWNEQVKLFIVFCEYFQSKSEKNLRLLFCRRVLYDHA